MKTDDRIVVLLGAGSVVEGSGVSTASLTKKVIEATGSCGCLVRRICDEYNNLYNTGRVSNRSDINFEDIYNIVELLDGYGENRPVRGFAPQERVFVQLKQIFNEIQHTEIFLAQDTIITTLNDEIHCYDATRLQTEQGRYFRTFFAALDRELQCKLDVFNLNYDTWVEQSLPTYSDGFIDMPERHDIKRFNIDEYLNTNRHRVSHLHGQIYFEFPPIDLNHNRVIDLNFHEPFDTLYKYNDYEIAKRHREGTVHSRNNNQNGNPIYKTNIITGMLKLDKLLRHPMDLYFGEFIHSLTTNNKIIVVGYGFMDLYINQLLFLFNSAHLKERKIVLIDYLPKNELKMIVEHPFHASQDKAAFSNLMFQNDFWWANRRRELNEEIFHYSDDHNAMLCVKGCKWASDHIDEVVAFLKD